MRLLVAFFCLILQLRAGVSAKSALPTRQLHPRDYQTKDYYALELSQSVSPQVVARHFGLEYEGPIGELARHHLFSGAIGPQDIVGGLIERYRKKRTRDSSVDGLYNSILFAEKQRLKKLEKRSIPPPPPFKRQKAVSGEVEALEGLMQTLDIQDPIFHQQWHLV